ncbi:hypothetical protein PAHAL_6G124400 [Panicum hallii]|uniref:Uncharacterized protein n=1 Tax=Panicum hallii TaxID=206008 RepID=A0A2T8IG17_9POAL|nr:hypothetical protein PAHAL_6G124400 [Panicum hallii]
MCSLETLPPLPLDLTPPLPPLPPGLLPPLSLAWKLPTPGYLSLSLYCLFALYHL